MEKFKFLEHTADVKFQAFGKSVEEVFENSAMAFKEAVCEGIDVRTELEEEIKVNGKDYESLLYNFLEEILYLLDTKNFLISDVKSIEIEGFELNAVIVGDNSLDYDFTNDVKAVTYSDMFVRKEKDGWTTQVVLDV